MAEVNPEASQRVLNALNDQGFRDAFRSDAEAALRERNVAAPEELPEGFFDSLKEMADDAGDPGLRVLGRMAQMAADWDCPGHTRCVL